MRQLSVLDLLETSAEKYPEKAAVITPKGSYSYRRLLEDAKRLGAFIHEAKGRTNEPVCIFMEKSYLHLAAMYGTLYSGNFYVPVDNKTPLERLESILTAVETRFVLTNPKGKKELDKMGFTGEVYVIDENEEGLTVTKDESLLALEGGLPGSIRENFTDTSLMYLIFTSGSTGVPKGVAINHRAVMDYIDAFISEIGLDENDICGNQAPFYTDFSLRDIYGSAAVGAAICIIPQSYFISPKRLLNFMDESGVTFLSWVPTAYRLVSQFDGLSKVRPGALKKLLFSGEGMPVPVYSYWKSFYGNAEFIQCYGPTEATGACCYFKAGGDYDESDTIPIGHAFKNTGILLLDEEDNIIDITSFGVKGEICVYGTCLADGYYNNPEKTDAAFVQNPLFKGTKSLMYRTGDLGYYNPEGELVFSSRKDYQVKHMGKRIELGEIETAFAAVEEIKACCCTHNTKDDALVLYYTGDIDKKELSLRVGKKLPQYMIPADYVQLEELPMLESGKLDRKKMAQMTNNN